MNYITKKQANFSISLSLILALIFVFIFILPLVTCPLWGQVVQKKQLTQADYKLFGELQLNQAAPNGRWVSFNMIYPSGEDTLFVKNTSNKKIYSFPGASNGQFLAGDRFVCESPKGLLLLNLNTQKQQSIPSVAQYAYAPDSDQLILMRKSTGSQADLLLLDAKGKTTEQIKGVMSFSMSPDGHKVIYCTTEDGYNSVALLELAKQNTRRWIIQKSRLVFTTPTWQKKTKALAFFATDPHLSSRSLLFYYRLDKHLLYEMNSEKMSGFPADKTLRSDQYPISISEDLSKVFFGIGPKAAVRQDPVLPDTDSSVELWNANAKWIYPMERKRLPLEQQSTLAVWFPLTDQLLELSSSELPQVMLGGNQQYAILSNAQCYEPQFDLEGPRDFYIMDLNTAKKELLLEKQPTVPSQVLPTASPGGHYITYFRDNNWWIYDLRSKAHINISTKLPSMTSIAEPYGVAGWSLQDKEIILYDQYDLWRILPDGSKATRMTHGREQKIQFRINRSGFEQDLLANYNGWTHTLIEMEKGLFLQAKGDDGKTGYFRWKDTDRVIPIVYKDSYLTKLQAIDHGKSFIYQDQKFNESPRVVSLENKKARIVFQSNPDQSKYGWGTSELLFYYNEKGEKLKSLLYYPAHYNPEKKYPMIVHIYEEQASQLHKFINPSMMLEDGYNPTVLTSQGYFVLCPDIIRKDQHEGQSALDFTMAATREVISRNLVYPDKIGLMGHSFGGYQTTYIITQTGLFAAAVAGSAVTDLTSYYFTVNWKTGRPTMNYFQKGQLRMMQSPYEIPELYKDNSPLVYADRITTPLLSFTGKEDNHVDWHQSVELYLAMRRLGKKHVMLLYPKEPHSLLNPANQKDLSLRIQQWFGYYLKGQTPAPWITEAIK